MKWDVFQNFWFSIIRSILMRQVTYFKTNIHNVVFYQIIKGLSEKNNVNLSYCSSYIGYFSYLCVGVFKLSSRNSSRGLAKMAN